MLLRKIRQQKNAGHRPQYELDFDLNPLEKHFMFWEYLEIGKSRKFNDQICFVTISHLIQERQVCYCTHSASERTTFKSVYRSLKKQHSVSVFAFAVPSYVFRRENLSSYFSCIWMIIVTNHSINHLMKNRHFQIPFRPG